MTRHLIKLLENTKATVNLALIITFIKYNFTLNIILKGQSVGQILNLFSA